VKRGAGLVDAGLENYLAGGTDNHTHAEDKKE
jgi:hypothetical protein